MLMNEPAKAVTCESRGRRCFFKEVVAGIISAVLGIIPLGAGLVVLFDPLRRSAGSTGLVKVTSLEALPDDGIPRRFQVLATRIDAWNKFAQVPIGAVYLRRLKDGKIQAFNAVCPHAGCFVEFVPDRGIYSCPCHKSSFNIAGQIENRSSPASRGLDSLAEKWKRGVGKVPELRERPR